MRRSYLITYDIRDDKRLRKVYRTMKNFGDHLQYSVFECQLSLAELQQCRAELAAIIHHRLDQVLFVDLGPSDYRGERVITALGQAYTPLDAACCVV
jgi:CRISPR-associated protein Cas2